jgi:arylsulfatase A-like enzyme
LTGKYGHNSDVNYVPAPLSDEHTIIQQYLKDNEISNQYESAVFGKWHVGGGRSSDDHPNTLGVDYYAGNLSNVGDYLDWELTINGETQQSSEYHTSKITDLAIDWIGQQSQPWFAWVAYSAPHSPYHLPPETLHERDLSGEEQDINSNKREYYLAAIEAMDTEIGRLLASLEQSERDNTIIIYLGDNGTPSNVIDQDAYRVSHSKGSLYQGGVAVPLVVSGKGVTRQNQREKALIKAPDFFATFAQITGHSNTKVNDGQSFYGLLSDDTSNSQELVFTEYESDNVTGWAVRSDDYKIIVLDDGTELFYSMVDFKEEDNLIDSSNSDVQSQITRLKTHGETILGITNNDVPVDITNALLTNTSSNCADYVESFTSSVMDVNENKVYFGDLTISVNGDKCIFQTNAIPNHDFNDGGQAFPNAVSEQNDTFEITTTPTKAQTVTEISLETDNAILLNGVKVDLLAAGCYGIGNGKIGCNDMSTPWRYDPMHTANGFNVDTHNAHAQPDGTYHYHGSPLALFDNDASVVSPVIGFAADGFPIFGSYFDDNGTIRKAQPSYQLKSGTRPTDNDQPGGSYDGAFRDDYEYVEGLGDLDECNGMTVNGVYGYFITDNYPYVLACYTGTPDASFNK